MGLTPLEGLPGATRSGSVDPSVIFHYTHDPGQLSRSSPKDVHITMAEEILNKECGWMALTGTTDFGAISAKAAQKDKQCSLAFDIFVDRILGFVGSYYVKLGGNVDALVFAGGIGQNGVPLREAVVKGAGCLGFAIDGAKNKQAMFADAVVQEISAQGARHRVLVCRTDEQLEMAREVARNPNRF